MKSRLTKSILSLMILSLFYSNLCGQKNEAGFERMSEIIDEKSNPCPEFENLDEYREAIIPEFKGSQREIDSLNKIYENALSGNAEAQYQLGRTYYTGNFIKQSYYKAAQYYAKAAGQHHRKAAYEMAMLVESDYPHDQMLMTRYLILGLEGKKEELVQDTLWVKGNEYFENERYDLSSAYLKRLLEKYL